MTGTGASKMPKFLNIEVEEAPCFSNREEPVFLKVSNAKVSE